MKVFLIECSNEFKNKNIVDTYVKKMLLLIYFISDIVFLWKFFIKYSLFIQMKIVKTEKRKEKKYKTTKLKNGRLFYGETHDRCLLYQGWAFR
jgi:hypothetical protein